MQSAPPYSAASQTPATNAAAAAGTVIPAPTPYPLNPPSPVTMVERYRHRQSIGLGVTQVIIGVLCIVFNAVSLRYYDGIQMNGVGFVGHGFWIGILFIVTGILGIMAGKNKSKCSIVAFMVMCIISSTFTVVLLALGIGGSVATSYGSGRACDSYDYGYDYYSYYFYYRPPCYAYQVVVAMEACMAVAGFIEAWIAIWGSVICCQSGVCCCSGPPQAVVLPMNFYSSNGQIMYLTPTQGVQMVYAPSPATVHYQHGMVVPPLSYQTTFAQPAWTRPQLEGTAPPPPYPTGSQPLQQQTHEAKF